MSAPLDSAPAPARRLIVLGASNVVSGMDTIAAIARAASGGPVEIHAAMGYGRAYGTDSSFLGVRRSAIRRCGILEAVAARPPLPASALVTDIGADLLYGADPDHMVESVMACVDALCDAGVEVRVAQLPVYCLDTIGPVRYRMFRTMFFPRCRLTLRELGRRALAANSQIIFAASERRVACVTMAPEWYGVDPIHIAQRRGWEAWSALLGGRIDAPERLSEASARGAARLREIAANPAKIRGFWRLRSLLSARHARGGGTTITLY